MTGPDLAANKTKSHESGYQAEPTEFEICKKTTLLKALTTQEKFDYKITLKNPVNQPLVKERNFRIDLELVNIHTGQVVKNSNKLFLITSIYSSECPPKLVEFNTGGNPNPPHYSLKIFL